MESSIGVMNMRQMGRDKDDQSAFLLRKIERSYRKRIYHNLTNGDGRKVNKITQYNEEESKITEAMKSVRLILQTLRSIEGDEMAENVMFLFNRLAGTKSTCSININSNINNNSNINSNKSIRKIHFKEPESNNETNIEDTQHDNLNNAITSSPSDVEQDDEQSSNARQVVEGSQNNIPEEKKNSTSLLTSRNNFDIGGAIYQEEKKILRECLHALQNVDGDFITCHYGSNSKSLKSREQKLPYDGIQIHVDMPWNTFNFETLTKHSSSQLMGGSGCIDALKICCEAGWLYSHIKLYIDSIFDTSKIYTQHILGNTCGGVISRALASTLSEHLSSYLSFLASLEQQLLHKSNTLTLRRLIYLLRVPIAKLRTMALLTGGISPDVTGGELLTALHLHSMHGDPRHSELVFSIINSVSIPWYKMLYDWVFHGIISGATKCSNEKRGEFFVIEDESVPDKLMWHNRYVLCEHQIPDLPPGLANGREFMDAKLAREVLVVGKGINFIQRCLKDMNWMMNMKGMYGLPENITEEETRYRLGFCFHTDSNRSINFTNGMDEEMSNKAHFHTLHQTIAIATNEVHSHILLSLFNNYHLIEHLQALKEFLFLGQGDFVCALIEGLNTELQVKTDTPKKICMQTMMGILHDSIRSTNAKFLPKYVLERVHVELITDENLDSFDENSSQSDIEPWDYFMLNYNVPSQLNAILHPSAIVKYQRVFTLLFRLKRIEWMLNNTWKQSTAFNHALHLMATRYTLTSTSESNRNRNEEYFRMQLLLRKTSMTRQTILHFISNLQSYLMFEVLESGWKRLSANIKAAKTLDDVICSHNDYLDEIETKSLLGEQQQTSSLGQQLQSVLDISYKFCMVHEEIFNLALSSIDMIVEKRRHAEQRSNTGKWGFEQVDTDVDEEQFYHLSEVDKLDEVEFISNNFDAAIRAFLSMLNDSVDDIGSTQEEIMSPTDSPKTRNAEINGAFGRETDIDKDALRFLTFRLDFSEFYS